MLAKHGQVWLQARSIDSLSNSLGSIILRALGKRPYKPDDFGQLM